MSSIKISSILGNSQSLDGGAMFGNAPKVVWQNWIKPDHLNRIPLNCRALLVEAKNGLKILCETGIGGFFEPQLAQRFGVQEPTRHLLIENLQNLGVDEEDISYVILSHLHFDHAGGLLPTYQEIQAGHDGLKFPKAQYIVGHKAWERAQRPHFRDRASFIPELNKRLQASDRLLVLPKTPLPNELKDLIEFYYSNGHTPGQMHTLVKGTKDSIFFAGDLIPGAAWVHLPITMGYDRYPERLIEEKQNIFESLNLDDQWFFYTHDPYIAASKVRLNEKKKYEAMDKRADLNRVPL